MSKRPLPVFDRIRKENPEKYQEMMVELYEQQKAFPELLQGAKKGVLDGFKRLEAFVESIEPETRERLTADAKKKMAAIKKRAAANRKKKRGR